MDENSVIQMVIADRYCIEGLIAKGGMSELYIAKNIGTGEKCVIKKMRVDSMINDLIIHQSLIAEKEILKGLAHPNLVRIEDSFIYNKEIILVMEYVDGMTIEAFLRKNGKAVAEDAVRWMSQLADVLGYLHSQRPKIIYQDLKPSNIMLRPDGSITLIDFGTARMVTDYNEKSVPAANSITAHSLNNRKNDSSFQGGMEHELRMGTAGYCAPEITCASNPQKTAMTPENDIYSFGMTFYSILTGMNPAHPLFKYDEMAVKELAGNGTDKKKYLLIKKADDIIKACIRTNPAKRYHSAAAIYRDLVHIDDESRISMTSGGHARPGRCREISALIQEMRLSGTYTGIRKAGIENYNGWENIALPKDRKQNEIMIDLSDTTVRTITHTELKVFRDIVIVNPKGF